MTGLKAAAIYMVFVREGRRQKSQVGSSEQRCQVSAGSNPMSAPRKLCHFTSLHFNFYERKTEEMTKKIICTVLQGLLIKIFLCDLGDTNIHTCMRQEGLNQIRLWGCTAPSLNFIEDPCHA